jgi:hypothetical protein
MFRVIYPPSGADARVGYPRDFIKPTDNPSGSRMTAIPAALAPPRGQIPPGC